MATPMHGPNPRLLAALVTAYGVLVSPFHVWPDMVGLGVVAAVLWSRLFELEDERRR
jgi:hypothetical protein